MTARSVVAFRSPLAHGRDGQILKYLDPVVWYSTGKQRKNHKGVIYGHAYQPGYVVVKADDGFHTVPSSKLTLEDPSYKETQKGVAVVAGKLVYGYRDSDGQFYMDGKDTSVEHKNFFHCFYTKLEPSQHPVGPFTYVKTPEGKRGVILSCDIIKCDVKLQDENRVVSFNLNDIEVYDGTDPVLVVYRDRCVRGTPQGDGSYDMEDIGECSDHVDHVIETPLLTLQSGEEVSLFDLVIYDKVVCSVIRIDVKRDTVWIKTPDDQVVELLSKELKFYLPDEDDEEEKRLNPSSRKRLRLDSSSDEEGEETLDSETDELEIRLLKGVGHLHVMETRFGGNRFEKIAAALTYCILPEFAQIVDAYIFPLLYFGTTETSMQRRFHILSTPDAHVISLLTPIMSQCHYCEKTVPCKYKIQDHLAGSVCYNRVRLVQKFVKLLDEALSLPLDILSATNLQQCLSQMHELSLKPCN